LGSLLFARKLPAFREMVRPIYLERGILSQRSLPIVPPEPEGT